MSELLPIFPLPNVVLFPNVFQPLHIFERRYRSMVADALETDRMIGMVLLRPGWEAHYEAQPPVFPIGCSGVITHTERLDDGRFNIVVRGVERFRILREDHDRLYRRALIEPFAEHSLTAQDRDVVRSQRTKLESLLSPAVGTAATDPRTTAAMSDEDLVNALAQYLGLEPLEKQALLEKQSLRCRAESLVELLEMKILMARTPGVSKVAH
jgi:Lon protease-like protein